MHRDTDKTALSLCIRRG